MRLEYINCIILFIQNLLCALFFTNVLKFKVGLAKVTLILSGVIFFIFIATFSIRTLPIIKPALMGAALYITIRKLSKSSSKRILLAVAVAIGCGLLTDVFSYYTYGVFTGFDYSNANEISITRSTVYLFSTIFYFTLTMTIAIFMNKISGNIKKFCISLLIILPVSQLLLLFGIYINNYENLNEGILKYGVLCLSISIVVDSIIYFIINEYAKIAKREKDIEVQRIQSEMELSYYLQVAKSEEDLHQIKHDIKNQLQAAYALFDSGDVGKIKAKSIVESIKDKMDSIDKLHYCANPVVNTIMSIKSLEARNNHIDTEVEIGLIDSGIEDIDLCSIFINLFDNAIESCKHNKSKENNFIKIKVGKVGGYLVVKFINWCDAELKVSEKKNFITTKKDRKNHGYGLKILKEITDKYEGEVKLKAEDNIFEAVLYLKVS